MSLTYIKVLFAKITHFSMLFLVLSTREEGIKGFEQYSPKLTFCTCNVH